MTSAPPTTEQMKALAEFPRATGGALKGGWTIDPDYLEKVQNEVEAAGWDAQWEAIQTVLLHAERALASHKAAPEMRERVEPIAWMYERPNDDVYFWTQKNDERHDPANGWTETPLFPHPPALPDQQEAWFREGVEAAAKFAESVKNYDDALQSTAGCLPVGRRIAKAIRALTPPARVDADEGVALPADVRALVIAARGIMDAGDATPELDSALEAFSSRVPYEDDPARVEDDEGVAAYSEAERMRNGCISVVRNLTSYVGSTADQATVDAAVRAMQTFDTAYVPRSAPETGRR